MWLPMNLEQLANILPLNAGRNIIAHQGGVTVQPYYNKVKDFGMEFEMRDGKVNYLGLSLFDTIKNAYSGNLLCSEEDKLDILKQYVSEETLSSARQRIIDIITCVEGYL